MNAIETTVMTAPVVATTQDTKIPKSLPMKPKTIQCGIVGFLKAMELEGKLVTDVCETLIAQLPLFGTVEEQVKYYDEKFDLKHIEQTYIKPRIAEHKKSLKPPKAPRKSRAKKEKTGEKSGEKTATKTEVSATPELKDVYEAKEVVEMPNTPELNKEVKEAPTAPAKKQRAKKGEGEKKTKGRKVKETEVVFSRDEDEDGAAVNNLNVDMDLEAEEYVGEKPKEEKPKKKRAPVKKKDENTKTKTETKTETKKEEEHWMIMRDNVRYWTTDENEKNGAVFANKPNEDGDSSPGDKVGELKDGLLVLF